MERNSIANGERRQPGIDHVILIQKLVVGPRAREGRKCSSCRHDPLNTLADRCLLTSATDLISRQAPMSRGSIVASAGVESRVDHAPRGQVAEWLCSGLQSRVHRFDSGPSLHLSIG